MFDIKKLSVLSVLGSVLLASTSLQAMPPEENGTPATSIRRPVNSRIAALQGQLGSVILQTPAATSTRPQPVASIVVEPVIEVPQNQPAPVAVIVQNGEVPPAPFPGQMTLRKRSVRVVVPADSTQVPVAALAPVAPMGVKAAGTPQMAVSVGDLHSSRLRSAPAPQKKEPVKEDKPASFGATVVRKVPVQSEKSTASTETNGGLFGATVTRKAPVQLAPSVQTNDGPFGIKATFKAPVRSEQPTSSAQTNGSKLGASMMSKRLESKAPAVQPQAQISELPVGAPDLSELVGALMRRRDNLAKGGNDAVIAQSPAPAVPVVIVPVTSHANTAPVVELQGQENKSRAKTAKGKRPPTKKASTAVVSTTVQPAPAATSSARPLPAPRRLPVAPAAPAVKK